MDEDENADDSKHSTLFSNYYLKHFTYIIVQNDFMK